MPLSLIRNCVYPVLFTDWIVSLPTAMCQDTAKKKVIKHGIPREAAEEITCLFVFVLKSNLGTQPEMRPCI